MNAGGSKQGFPEAGTGFGTKTLLKQKALSMFRWLS
jgi:hypothetical protein